MPPTFSSRRRLFLPNGKSLFGTTSLAGGFRYTKSRCRKITVYFVKLFSSAYMSTVENNFAESKQWCGFLDENRTIFMLFISYPLNQKSFFLSPACDRPVFFDNLKAHHFGGLLLISYFRKGRPLCRFRKRHLCQFSEKLFSYSRCRPWHLLYLLCLSFRSTHFP